ncbi:hypothetical protein F7725_029189 [Dissostichus mawsoni]|uniref:Uncharacterized protein n=1 Tax=Dissostichus mawsoni TaxID=36200 RepID=A0A7J5XI75_DISMA|nr:hypothetical protein F7725_029189 [Dissostichus mawsoni]
MNDSFVRYCHTDTEAFLSEIDRSLSSSRRVFEQLKRKHPITAQTHCDAFLLTSLPSDLSGGLRVLFHRKQTFLSALQIRYCKKLT